MKTYGRILFACLCGLLLAATSSQAKPKGEYHQIKVHAEPIDTVGDVDGTYPAPRKALQDTVWIADDLLRLSLGYGRML